ncbi:MAG: flagellar biosynthesis protein FliQ [Ruminococcus sp.]|jgi:flagellar biosynthetic protein FliQ|nr:flagellar biosynthesis protein FliQ [Ruminococcus sp.]
MTEELIQQLFREALLLIIRIAGPLLLVSMIVGLVIAVFQAATQIHEQTLTFVPKAFIIALLLFLLAPVIITSLSDFFNQIFEMMQQVAIQTVI